MQKTHNARTMEIRSKVWIEVDGQAVFGRGRRFLLEAIAEHGSINQAAKEVGISFRKAWGHIKVMEDRLGVRLVKRQTGGRNGGGTVITKEAQEFIARFEKLDHEVQKIVDRQFGTLFAGGRHV